MSDIGDEQPASGYRVLPHTADVALTAWAPSRPECVAAAVRGLVDSFVDVSAAPARDSVAFVVESESDDDLLVSVLDEVIYQVEVHGRIPVDVEVTDDNDARSTVRFATASADQVEVTGAVPKAISLHELRFGCSGGMWRCHVTVDV